MRGYVYKWTNLLNGKWYIGSTCGNNPNYKAGGIAIKKAFKKYGMNNFNKELFMTNDYLELEQFLLDETDAANDSMSYNMKNSAIGAAIGSSYHLGYKHSDEAKAKMKAAKLGKKRRKFSAEARYNMSASKSGANHPGFRLHSANNHGVFLGVHPRVAKRLLT